MGKCVKEEKWRVRNYETRGKDKERGKGKKDIYEKGSGGRSIEHGIRKRKTEGKEEMHGKTMMRKSNEKGRKESQG